MRNDYFGQNSMSKQMEAVRHGVCVGSNWGIGRLFLQLCILRAFKTPKVERIVQ